MDQGDSQSLSRPSGSPSKAPPFSSLALGVPSRSIVPPSPTFPAPTDSSSSQPLSSSQSHFHTHSLFSGPLQSRRPSLPASGFHARGKSMDSANPSHPSIPVTTSPMPSATVASAAAAAIASLNALPRPPFPPLTSDAKEEEVWVVDGLVEAFLGTLGRTGGSRPTSSSERLPSSSSSSPFSATSSSSASSPENPRSRATGGVQLEERALAVLTAIGEIGRAIRMASSATAYSLPKCGPALASTAKSAQATATRLIRALSRPETPASLVVAIRAALSAWRHVVSEVRGWAEAIAGVEERAARRLIASIELGAMELRCVSSFSSTRPGRIGALETSKGRAHMEGSLGGEGRGGSSLSTSSSSSSSSSSTASSSATTRSSSHGAVSDYSSGTLVSSTGPDLHDTIAPIGARERIRSRDHGLYLRHRRGSSDGVHPPETTSPVPIPSTLSLLDPGTPGWTAPILAMPRPRSRAAVRRSPVSHSTEAYPLPLMEDKPDGPGLLRRKAPTLPSHASSSSVPSTTTMMSMTPTTPHSSSTSTLSSSSSSSFSLSSTTHPPLSAPTSASSTTSTSSFFSTNSSSMPMTSPPIITTTMGKRVPNLTLELTPNEERISGWMAAVGLDNRVVRSVHRCLEACRHTLPLLQGALVEREAQRSEEDEQEVNDEGDSGSGGGGSDEGEDEEERERQRETEEELFQCVDRVGKATTKLERSLDRIHSMAQTHQELTEVEEERNEEGDEVVEEEGGEVKARNRAPTSPVDMDILRSFGEDTGILLQAIVRMTRATRRILAEGSGHPGESESSGGGGGGGGGSSRRARSTSTSRHAHSLSTGSTSSNLSVVSTCSAGSHSGGSTEGGVGEEEEGREKRRGGDGEDRAGPSSPSTPSSFAVHRLRLSKATRQSIQRLTRISKELAVAVSVAPPSPGFPTSRSRALRPPLTPQTPRGPMDGARRKQRSTGSVDEGMASGAPSSVSSSPFRPRPPIHSSSSRKASDIAPTPPLPSLSTPPSRSVTTASIPEGGMSHWHPPPPPPTMTNNQARHPPRSLRRSGDSWVSMLSTGSHTSTSPTSPDEETHEE
ncbi:MAG: hypothetical protein DHS80DRAFT_29387 [Piptocephalis tieghemiana]|nr:MAG: hypothetical protein DHS80DRAFT_29387 [Piptocephalis tieghemiana]